MVGGVVGDQQRIGGLELSPEVDPFSLFLVELKKIAAPSGLLANAAVEFVGEARLAGAALADQDAE